MRKSTVGMMIGILLLCSQAHATPVRNIVNLASITFWEATGNPITYTFGVNSAQLTQRRPDPLSNSNMDFSGVVGHEFYDVFYSNQDGTFNIDGEYLTIEGV
ncbi:MAG: hypothetical protein ED859_06680 [Desulfuromonadales bacterium]|nr:MAG: hypothetical protein ED859_06680 [Desulfuromonadales bacterium]